MSSNIVADVCIITSFVSSQRNLENQIDSNSNRMRCKETPPARASG